MKTILTHLLLIVAFASNCQENQAMIESIDKELAQRYGASLSDVKEDFAKHTVLDGFVYLDDIDTYPLFKIKEDELITLKSKRPVIIQNGDSLYFYFDGPSAVKIDVIYLATLFNDTRGACKLGDAIVKPNSILFLTGLHEGQYALYDKKRGIYHAFRIFGQREKPLAFDSLLDVLITWRYNLFVKVMRPELPPLLRKRVLAELNIYGVNETILPKQ